MTAVYEYFRQLSARLIGNTLEADRAYVMEGRLAALAAREKLSTVRALVLRLQEQAVGPLHWEAVEAVTNKETLFFRDEGLFNTLQTEVLSNLVDMRRSTRSLRIWSAACSSGQEPYSLVMMLVETWPEIRDWDVRVLASDISTEALERARTGWYSEFEVARGLSEERRMRHFDKAVDGWSVRAPLRAMVHFQRINLASPWPPLEPQDLVLLRNVMLYFDRDMRRGVLQRVHASMAPQGYLFLGAAENLLHDEDLFTPFVLGRTLGFRPA